MKIVRRIDFLKLPSETVYSEYVPCVFGELLIKGETLNVVPEGDWWLQRIADSIVSKDCGEWADKQFRSQETGESMEMDFDIEQRDGSFDPDDRLYAIWELQDVQHLINRLKRCVSGPLEER
jgi:hypothetical protein